MVSTWMQTEVLDKIAKLEQELADVHRAVQDASKEVAGATTASELALTIQSLNEYIRTINKAIRLAKRAGLPEDFAYAATQVQKLIRMVNQLRIAYTLLASARLAAGDPIAIAQAGIAIGSVILTSVDTG